MNNKKYEVVIDNEYMKVVRLRYGVLVNIYKYELGISLRNQVYNARKELKKIEDNFYKTKIEFTYRDLRDKKVKINLPVGTVLYKESSGSYSVVERKLSKKDWLWELKTTGSCFSGDTEKFTELIDTVKEIIENE